MSPRRPVLRVYHQQPRVLGSEFHFRQSYTPAYVLTDLSKRIIIGNRTDARDLQTPKTWVITGFRSHVTRMWAASTAVVTATVHLPDLGEQPPPPPEQLALEAEVQVWAGYTEHPRVVVPEDLCVRLLPVFTGIVETITVTVSGTGGYVLTLQLRDRMKWFLDSVVTYQPGVDGRTPRSRYSSLPRDARQPTRSQILVELARRAIGRLGDGCAGCGKSIHLGAVVDVGAGDRPAAANLFEARLTPRRACAQPLEDPEFHIYTQRTFRQGTPTGRGFSVDNRVAVEMMRYLAMSEVYPTELFQDHRDGNFYYTPRFNVLDGFHSPDYFYRTYYVKNYPQGVTPDIAQMVLSFKEEASSVGVKTNFLVSRHGTLVNETLDTDWVVHLRAIPHRFAPRYACKFFEARDDELDNVTEAAIVALQLARIRSKDLRAAMMVVLGDPSFVPGEVVQVVGSPMWGLQTLDLDRLQQERQDFEERNRNYNEYLMTVAEDAAQAMEDPKQKKASAVYTIPRHSGLVAEDTPISPRVATQDRADTLVCEPNVAVLPEEPMTLWRVEAVLQRANMGGSKGYVTELLLVGLF